MKLSIDKTRSPSILVLILSVFWIAGCRQEMGDQPYHKPLEPSTFFEDGQSARHLVPGTVARGHVQDDELLYNGTMGGEEVDSFPFPVTHAVLERGQERYNIFCAPCHDHVGTGRGMIVQRGFPRPPSYHIPRLREAPASHFFDVITSGFGRMYDYSHIPPADRWAIIAYIRALQLSQHAALDDVPPEERQQLQGASQ